MYRRTTLLAAAVTVGLLTASPANAVVDHKPPTVTVQAPPTPVSGWFTSRVELVIVASDPSGIDPASRITLTGAQEGSTGFTFGVDSTSAVVDVTHEGTTTVTWDVIDTYGNHARGSQVVKLDTVLPAAYPSAPAEGLVLRQYSQPPQASAVYGDYGGSGVASHWLSGDVDSSSYLDTKSAGAKAVEFHAVDVAGNAATVVRHYTVTPYTRPVVTITADTTPNANGWYRSPAQFHAHAIPGQTGTTIAKMSWPGGTVDGSNATVIASESNSGMVVKATDSNGIDSTAVLTPTVLIDAVAPTVDVPEQQPVTVGDDVTPVHSCADDASGVESCTLGGDVTDGKLDTASPGVHAFTVTATDLAGNSTTTQREYTVNAAASTQPIWAVTSTSARFTVRRHKVTALVSVASSSPANGTVTVRDGAKVIGSGTLVNGSATLQLVKLKRGKHVLTVVYAGSATTSTSSTVVKVRVR